MMHDLTRRAKLVVQRYPNVPVTKLRNSTGLQSSGGGGGGTLHSVRTLCLHDDCIPLG